MASEDTTRRRVTVRGDVQGVFFRDSVREEAERRGVAGWASNRPDGSVEAVFEGPGPAVDALVEFCRADPGRSTVNEVESVEEGPEGLSGFSVR